MGRVARYKKIKSCDPFAKNGGLMTNVWGEGDNGRRPKKRSLTVQKLRSKKRQRGAGFTSDDLDHNFDKPPEGKDDFDLADLVGSLKSEKPVNLLMESKSQSKPSKVEVAAGPKEALSLDEERRDAKILKISLETKKVTSVAPRMEGESKRAFFKRMQEEARRAIRKEKIDESGNPEKKERKKEFLKSKKQKKKKTAGSSLDISNRPADVDESDVLVTGERAIAAQRVRFGDQVERPPTFQVLPRGATVKKSVLSNTLSDKGITNDQQLAQQRSLTKMRDMVQARYALIKAQRKQNQK